MPSKSSKQKNKAIAESMRQTHLKRQQQTCHVFKVKIKKSKLTTKQKEQLKMLFVEAKWLKNDCLNFSNQNNNSVFNYQVPKKNGEIKVKVKNEFQIRQLNFIGSQMIQSVIDEMKSNIKMLNTLKKKGHKVGALKFCKECKSINLKQYGNTYKFKSKYKMKLQGVSGYVHINGFQQFDLNECDFANAKILNTPNGYYVAITVFKNKKNNKENYEYLNEIGIDFGCTNNITTSDNQHFNCYIEETERLKRLQRKLMKQKKGSNNYIKTKTKIRQQYQKMHNKKLDAANKVVYELLKHKTVYMQDEQLSAWKEHYHGKSVQHSYLGLIKAKLMNNSRVKVIDKFVATTKQCYCGYKWNNLTESIRILKCPNCGLNEDRDLHAAKMMIILGQDLNNLILRKELAEVKRVDSCINEAETRSSQSLD